ncbi:MAG: hypothetical protein JSR91_11770 [Proteobacteria bacterium]|nr:hypothetical protein [Pseudomonadota bacterium]
MDLAPSIIDVGGPINPLPGVIMPSLFEIVAHTPLWVWFVMALVVWLGPQGLRPRIVPIWRPALLPMVGLALSLSGVAQALHPGLALAGWSAAFVLALPLGHAIGCRRPVRRRPDGRLEIAGGWFALIFGVSIFAVRYALGVLFGVAPALAHQPLWICLSAAVGGFVSGIGVGWFSGLLMQARQSLTPAE